MGTRYLPWVIIAVLVAYIATTSLRDTLPTRPVSSMQSAASSPRARAQNAETPLVFAFFDRGDGKELDRDWLRDSENGRMLQLWSLSWQARVRPRAARLAIHRPIPPAALQGWIPRVLTMRDAERHKHYEYFRKRLSVLASRTVIGKSSRHAQHYELTNFMRWVAMSAAGGGCFTDHDVINYSLRPEDVPDLHPTPITFYGVHRQKTDHLVVQTGPVCGTAEEYERIASIMAAFPTEEPGPSYNHGPNDISVIRFHHPGQVRMHPLAPNPPITYGSPGWETSTAVHYYNNVAKHPRSSWIHTVRPLDVSIPDRT